MKKHALMISILLILLAVVFAGCRTVDTRDDDWRMDRGSSYSSGYQEKFAYGYRYQFNHGFNYGRRFWFNHGFDYGPHYPHHFRYHWDYKRGF